MLRAKIIYDRPPEMLVSRFKDAVVAGNTAALVYWHQYFLPEHFKPSAMAKYGYQPRQGTGEGPWKQKTTVDNRYKPPRTYTRTVRNYAYIWQKKRKMGHMNPLEYGGESKREAESNFMIRSTFAKGVGLFPSLPSYFYKYQKAGQTWTRWGQTWAVTRTQPDKAAELVMFTNDEMQKLAEEHEKAATDHLNGITAGH